mgnify:CR=1 FL=1
MKSIRVTILLFTTAVFLFGCAGMSKEQSGQGLGSIVGAIVGYNLGKGHKDQGLSLIHISSPRDLSTYRMPSSA